MKKAFTLIELLIVISIIAILSAVTLSIINVQRVRDRAQDSVRKEDVSAIAGALERYYADNNTYPVSASYINAYAASPGGLSILVPNYIKTMPSDPGGTWWYAYLSDGQNFCLCYRSNIEAESLNNCTDPNTTANHVCIVNPF